MNKDTEKRLRDLSRSSIVGRDIFEALAEIERLRSIADGNAASGMLAEQRIADLEARLAERNALNAEMEAVLSQAEMERDEAQKELEQAERDAKRYRYMRSNNTFQDRSGPGLYWYLPRWDRDLPVGDRLDNAIDANIREAAGGEAGDER